MQRMLQVFTTDTKSKWLPAFETNFGKEASILLGQKVPVYYHSLGNGHSELANTEVQKR